MRGKIWSMSWWDFSFPLYFHAFSLHRALTHHLDAVFTPSRSLNRKYVVAQLPIDCPRWPSLSNNTPIGSNTMIPPIFELPEGFLNIVHAHIPRFNQQTGPISRSFKQFKTSNICPSRANNRQYHGFNRQTKIGCCESVSSRNKYPRITYRADGTSFTPRNLRTKIR